MHQHSCSWRCIAPLCLQTLRYFLQTFFRGAADVGQKEDAKHIFSLWKLQKVVPLKPTGLFLGPMTGILDKPFFDEVGKV